MIRGVIFDLDGTLFEADYDWPAIKRQLGVSRADGSILDHLRTLPPEEARRKRELLESIEDRATREGRLKAGTRELLADLRRKGMRLALVTMPRSWAASSASASCVPMRNVSSTGTGPRAMRRERSDRFISSPGAIAITNHSRDGY